MRIADLIPPVLKKLINTQKWLSNLSNEKVYNSYSDAMSACAGSAYENSELIDVVYMKTNAYRDALTKIEGHKLANSVVQSLTGLMMAKQNNSEIRVIDFGGACGSQYFIVKKILGDKIRLHWSVVETKKMVQKARALQTDELRFFESISDVKNEFGDVDLFHSSGAIQYVPDPEITISGIINSGAHFLLLNRLSLLTGNGKYVVSTQESMLSANGTGPIPSGIQDRSCRYPIIYIGKEWLESQFGPKYRIAFNFGEPVIGTIDGQSIISTGYFASRAQNE